MLSNAGPKFRDTRSARSSSGIEEIAPESQAATRRRVPQVGVALFDNPKEMSAGWACIADKAPVRFGSVHDLNSDALWVTNLDWEEYRLRASKFSNLRRGDFLRSSLSQIAGDLGRRMNGEFAMETCPVLAKVVHQAVMIAVGVYGWEEPVSEMREDTLADDIRRSIGQAPKLQRHLRTAMVSAHQSYSSPDWPPTYEPDSFTITLRYNRLDYARLVMANPVPDEAWTYIPPERASELSIESLMNPAQPSLVEATVELGRIDPDMAALIAFGSQPGKRAGVRKWISQPELAWLARHTRVNVSSALVASSARPLPESAQLPPALYSDPLFSLSISAGLIAECHWTALASTTYNRTSRTNDVSAWAVWLRAVDRALSFELALRAQKAGFHVVGYGTGSVVLRLSRDRMQECLAFADDNNIAHPAFHPLFVQHGRLDLLSGVEIAA